MRLCSATENPTTILVPGSNTNRLVSRCFRRARPTDQKPIILLEVISALLRGLSVNPKLRSGERWFTAPKREQRGWVSTCNHTVVGEGRPMPWPLRVACSGAVDHVTSRDQARPPFFRGHGGQPHCRAVGHPSYGTRRSEWPGHSDRPVDQATVRRPLRGAAKRNV